MKLSIIVPSIRPQNLLRLYESIDIKDQFEMIVVGPTSPPFVFDNVKYFHSLRSPNCCQQIALHFAVGDYIAVASDDGHFLLGALQCALDMAEKNTVIVGKYEEGDNPIDMNNPDYYKFKYHKVYRLKGVPQEALIFNCGIISRELITDLGGWDAANFQVPTIAHADLGIRVYRSGAEMILQDKMFFKCSHQPGKTGDHAPIDIAQNKHDLPNFKKIYSKPNHRLRISMENWRNTDIKWKVRFK